MTLQVAVDTVWLATATFLVLLMQAGFLLLEGGRVRAKNSINVAQKNLSDLVVSWVGFFVVGFFVMFGSSVPVSTGEAPPGSLQFLYQLGFCATAASIVSGAVAERMSYRAYLLMAALISIVVYPLVGRSVWGDQYITEHTAWLADLGFVDFAGSTVVHCVGAWLRSLRLARASGDLMSRVNPFPCPPTIRSFQWLAFYCCCSAGWVLTAVVRRLVIRCCRSYFSTP
jgi:Amt family ammonium transporter